MTSAQIVVLVGFLCSCITARLVLLAGRAEVNLFSRSERSVVSIALTLLSGLAFMGLLIIGFFFFSWWVLVAIVIGLNILATMGTQADNFWSGLTAMPIFDFISIAAFAWALVLLIG